MRWPCEPNAISAAIKKKMADKGFVDLEDLEADHVLNILMKVSDPLKNMVQSQLVSSRHLFEKRANPLLHSSTSSLAAMNEFDSAWGTFETRMKIVPGKELLSLLNQFLQSEFGCALTPNSIIDSYLRSNIPESIKHLISKLHELAIETYSENDQQ